ncbi:MAG: glycosyltransferase N-terminal domain-containing protein, partial [Bdellovibrionales bacterium]
MYRILMFLIQVALKLCQPFLNKKIMYFYQNQGKLFKNSNPDSSPLWIHATSGELEYAIPLIEELSKNFSHIPLLVTHSSLSSKNNLDQLPVAMTGVIPLDSYYDVSNFLNLVRPRALLISRTEIWPELIHQLHEREIPSFLFSATFAPGSKKMGLFSRLFISQALTQMNKVFVVSRDDKQNAEKLFSELKVEALGDTRYDRVADKLS